ncbi:hypothetical protein DICPUDRAFT_97023 [Dictyostelium purpureum]|uniref:Uncharacterized protein n=1 Tax=Dictyostelium purpureum TaxID=5786 RepID=F0ZDC3_DICPU|nr:uncharacterized protein DICPUDRAFT_97023 [Dictyostelium purpureum]EGC38016.1 hypothetical protein DICPUDRAFT_97023 [Dictyostelium purpureum]|eukprot:XP_003285417.1 hypothetical protein DICPUDRAFT_97023 [Dictyostelium purpureum]
MTTILKGYYLKVTLENRIVKHNGRKVYLSIVEHGNGIPDHALILKTTAKCVKFSVCLSIRSQCGWKELDQNDSGELTFDLKVEVTGKSQRAPLFPLIFQLCEKNYDQVTLISKSVIPVKAITKIPKKSLRAELVPLGESPTKPPQAFPASPSDLINSKDYDEELESQEFPNDDYDNNNSNAVGGANNEEDYCDDIDENGNLSNNNGSSANNTLCNNDSPKLTSSLNNLKTSINGINSNNSSNNQQQQFQFQIKQEQQSLNNSINGSASLKKSLNSSNSNIHFLTNQRDSEINSISLSSSSSSTPTLSPTQSNISSPTLSNIINSSSNPASHQNMSKILNSSSASSSSLLPSSTNNSNLTSPKLSSSSPSLISPVSETINNTIDIFKKMNNPSPTH